MKQAALAVAVSLLALGGLSAASGEEMKVCTFELDALSFISFQDEEVYPIPSGGFVRFRFETPGADGTLRFSIEPEDVQIPSIEVDGSRIATYRLAKGTQGTIAQTEGGLDVQFPATISASLASPEGGGTTQYTLQFTTGSASATNLESTRSVSVDGMKLLESGGAMQLVGATTSREAAYPGPGKAVYVVLSGSFDHPPPLP